MNKALVLIDVQNDFIKGNLVIPGAEEVLPELVARLEKKDYDTLFLTQDTHSDNYLETQEGRNLPIPHCLFLSWGWELDSRIKNLSLFENTTVKSFLKQQFGSMQLALALAESNYTEIEFCGFATDICVLANIVLVKTLFPEARIIVNSRLCRGTTPEKHYATLAVLDSLQVKIV